MKCAECGKEGLLVCSSCGVSPYCSKECQRTHWAAHKTGCKRLKSLGTQQLKALVTYTVTNSNHANKQQVLKQLENVVEKTELLKIVAENVDIRKVEEFLDHIAKTRAPAPIATTTTPGTAGANGGGLGLNNVPAMNGAMPSPEQMKQQAAMMRRHPDQVRRSVPQLANFTDAQIIEYANQLEQAASDPNMLREIEKMSRMQPAERDRMQSIQDGLSGARKMDDAWIDETVTTLKAHKDLIKGLFRGRGAMMGGVSDAQIESFIDTAAALESWMLKWIFKGLLFLGTLVKPATEWYQRVDKMTLGLAGYVIAAVVVYLLYVYLYYLWLFVSWLYRLVFGASVASSISQAAAATATATGAATTTTTTAAVKASGASNPLLATVAAITAALGLGGAQKAAATTTATITQGLSQQQQQQQQGGQRVDLEEF